MAYEEVRLRLLRADDIPATNPHKLAKARLSTIDWKLIRAAQEAGKVITADMTGWGPGDARKYVTWFLE